MTDFVATKARFHLPKGVIYLDGNSLGPLPEGAMHRAQQTIESEWGEMLIRAWNLAGWMDQPRRVGDKIVPLIGAEPGTVVMGDTLSIKMYQALAAALAMRPDRKIVLSDTGNFPTDLYMAKGLIDSLARGHALKTVATRGGRGRHRRERRRAHKRPLAPVSVPAPLASRRPVPGAAYRQKKRPTTAPRPNATTSASTICRTNLRVSMLICRRSRSSFRSSGSGITTARQPSSSSSSLTKALRLSGGPELPSLY